MAVNGNFEGGDYAAEDVAKASNEADIIMNGALVFLSQPAIVGRTLMQVIL